MNQHWDRLSHKRALVCSYHVAQADRDSGSRRIFDFLRFLVEAGWAVTYYAADGIGNHQDAQRLRQRGVPVYDGTMVDFANLVKACDFDLALVAFWGNGDRCLPILREISPRTHVIVDSVDVHFVREVRQTFQQGSISESFLQDKHADRFVRELNTYAAADAVLTVSEKEANLINDLIGDSQLAHVAPDGEDLEPSHVPFSQRRGILFVGSFEHQPNVCAVEYLCKDVLPLVDPSILAEQPVYIVGNALTDRVRDFAKDLPDVRMIGWVPFVEPYFASARITVVPLLYGAGTKRKLIQALLVGTPSVSTTIGVEGLNLHGEEHVLIADDPEAFATAMTRLLTDETLWTKLAVNGREHLGASYHVEGARCRFWDVVNKTLANPPKKAPGWNCRRPEPLAVNTTPQPVPPRESAPKQRMNQRLYQELILKLRELVGASIPANATVAVISKGDNDLLELEGRRSWHFPQDPGGGYAGHYPADGTKAIEHLENLRRKGAEYLVIPSTSFWWMEHYREFKSHLFDRCVEVARDDDVGIIYSLLDSEIQTQRNGTVVTAEAPDKAIRSVRSMLPVTVNGGRHRLALHQPAVSSIDEDDEAVRLIAFYLPQFHPIPENDLWWGDGFTEWRNVAKADPLFAGHYQPHIPADVGFYDLRCPETRQQQAELAAEYGLHGLCYYHYWFQGRRLLERPFNEVLASGRPDFPFCLCWANDPWSRKWDGRTRDLLMPQTYSFEDDRAHIRWLIPALTDPRAIQVDGKPIFLVYRAKDLPDPQRTTDLWREEAQKSDLKGLYLLAMETAWDLGWDATEVGFDAKVLFQPQFGRLITHGHRVPIAGSDSLHVYDYKETWPILAEPGLVNYPRFDTVCPSWDNTARVGSNAVVLHNSTPEEYEAWLTYALEKAQRRPAGQRLVFLNAWNEWAEGCHLEPDQRHGCAYLAATRSALQRSSGVSHSLMARTAMAQR